MAVHKRSKNSRQRGSHTHGWGSKKKHRGAGNRGGRGLAGSGKMGDSKKPSIWKNKKYFGKHGFAGKKQPKVITIADIEKNIEIWLADKKATVKDQVYNVDLVSLGYAKLLGNGRPTKKYNLIVKKISKNAAEKLEQGGSKIVSEDN